MSNKYGDPGTQVPSSHACVCGPRSPYSWYIGIYICMPLLKFWDPKIPIFTWKGKDVLLNQQWIRVNPLLKPAEILHNPSVPELVLWWCIIVQTIYATCRKNAPCILYIGQSHTSHAPTWYTHQYPENVAMVVSTLICHVRFPWRRECSKIDMSWKRWQSHNSHQPHIHMSGCQGPHPSIKKQCVQVSMRFTMNT